jgi:carboxypeptidase D
MVLAIVFVVAAGAGYSDGAAPRSGSISVVEVTVGSREALDALSREFVVDDYRGGVATVYADAADLARLSALGYSYTTAPAEPKALGVYNTYASLTSELQAYAAAHPEIARLYSAGQSVQGRELWVLRVSDHPDLDEDEPEFRYVSTLHGDEPVGTELVLYLIDLLLSGYGSSTRLTNLVNETDLFFMPLANPDGLVLGTRFSAEGYDLNRNFPAYPNDFTGDMFDGESINLTGYPQEVRNIVLWSLENSFALSANLHTGALLVNYPYDDDGGPSGVPAISPDDALYRDVSLRYSTNNVPMYTSPNDPQLPRDGITNGAAWYVVDGGLQDWSYRFTGDMHVTIELSETKKPSTSQLATLWNNNRESMLAYMEAAHLGVRGVVTDGRNPVHARVSVAGNTQPVFTDPDAGDYHRMLLPGTYSLLVSAPGYLSKTVSNVVVQDGGTTRRDVVLVSAETDVNVDGKVNAADVQLVINGALGLPVPDTCDIDGGGIRASDVQLVVNASLRS